MVRLSAALGAQNQVERVLVDSVEWFDGACLHFKMPRDENNNDDESPRKESADEAGGIYTSDGAVVGDNDRLGGEESLAPPPAPFVQYGGATENTGSGLRSPGPFRQKYQCPSMRFSNLIAMPFIRFG